MECLFHLMAKFVTFKLFDKKENLDFHHFSYNFSKETAKSHDVPLCT